MRERVPEDTSYLYSTWLKSYRKSEAARRMNPGMYFEMHHEVIDGIFARPAAAVLVAGAPDGPEIYGWLCAEFYPDKTILHYAYTKWVFRGRFGVFRRLFSEMIARAKKIHPGSERKVYITHATTVGLTVLEHMGLIDKYGITRNPYWADRPPSGSPASWKANINDLIKNQTTKGALT